jgi:hypothetical protein
MGIDKQQILEFAKRHGVCVLSTAINNKSESALVDFGITEEFEIVFNTYKSSRKYKNLMRNPNVSIVIGFGELLQTLQYEGIAYELEGSDEGRIMSIFRDNLGFFRRWKIKDMIYFKVKPNWIRFSDFTEYPPKTMELNLEEAF